MSNKKREELMLDRPTSHGGWPGGKNNSWIGEKPVNDIIYDYLKSMGLIDDVPHGRLSESLDSSQQIRWRESDLNLFSNSDILIDKAGQLKKDIVSNMRFLIEGFKKWKKSWFSSPKLTPQEEKAIKIFCKCIFFLSGSRHISVYFSKKKQYNLGAAYLYFKENFPNEIKHSLNMFNIMHLVSSDSFLGLFQYIWGWMTTEDKFYDYIVEKGEDIFGTSFSDKNVLYEFDPTHGVTKELMLKGVSGIGKYWTSPQKIDILKRLTVNMHRGLMENKSIYSKRKIKKLIKESLQRNLK